MLSKYVAPGNRVEIQAVRQAKQRDGVLFKKYKSLILDTISDDRLEILMPIEKNRLIPLPINEEYDLFIYTAQGQYQCTAKAVDRYKSERKHLLLFELTSGLKKFQRREFFRLNCVLEMGTRPLVEEEIEAIIKDERFLVPGLPLKKAVIVDISGGGMRFVGRNLYNPDSFICCQCSLPMEGKKDAECVLAAKVLRVREMENKPKTYEHRVQFVNIDSKEREKIIHFIFEEERKLRNKGKGLETD